MKYFIVYVVIEAITVVMTMTMIITMPMRYVTAETPWLGAG